MTNTLVKPLKEALIMETFKIENYERLHGLGTFVPFRHLSTQEAEQLCESLRQRLGLPDDADGQAVVDAIHAQSELVPGANAEGDNFDLKRLLHELECRVSANVYLNWYLFDDVDELHTSDLINAFDDLWYPSSDDLDIVDSKMAWLVSITHDGAVRSLILGT